MCVCVCVCAYVCVCVKVCVCQRVNQEGTVGWQYGWRVKDYELENR